ncbi:hypothetical protein ACIBCA_18315 [Kitasatospora sp. NPDC051170]|uniref:hypothetical protein n=1 Tax=Kitasatospora sp. NPDC051170 TaxID=3364056 RepID=UPI00378F5B17
MSRRDLHRDVYDEGELRELLHRAVPPLATPDDRVRQVLAKAGRTRRRRRATGLAGGLGAGLLAAALAAAPAMAPRGPDAVIEPGAGASGSASAPGEPVVTTRFPAFSLAVDLPPGWQARSVTANPADGIGHLANLPFDAKPSCPANTGSCSPLGLLPADGAVLTVRLTTVTQQDTPTPAALTDMTLDKDCSTHGGTRELLGHRTVGTAEKQARVEVTACLRTPSQRTLGQVQHILDSARVAGPADEGSAVAEPQG